MVDASSPLRAMVDIARLYPSADNSQPLQFHLGEETISVDCSPGRCNQGHYFSPGSHAVQFSLGCALESMLITAKNIDTPVQVQEGEGRVTCRFPDIARARVTPAASDALLGRHTNRGPYRRQTLPQAIQHKLAGLSQGPVRAQWFETSQAYPLIQLLKQASSLRFRSPDLVEFLASSLRSRPEEVARGDGLDIETLCLPPGGGGLLALSTSERWLPRLNRFGFHRLLALFEGMMLNQSGALIAIYGGSLGADARSAGQLAMRVWVELNAAGVAVHPYYVVTDQLIRKQRGAVSPDLASEVDGLEQSVSDLFGGNALHIVFRVGYPRQEVVRSRRLPITDVCELE